MIKSRRKIAMGLDADRCPIRTVLDQISDKWSLLAIVELRKGTQRFTEISKAIPDISQRMLTKTLRKLEREGLITRKVTPSIPPRVDYSITELGKSLFAPLDVMAEWATQKRTAILKAREKYDNRPELTGI